VVVLPVAALAALTPEQVAAILAHELAHVRRHDFAVNLLQSIVEIVLFYHPAVWWISRQVRIEREHCCDAIAVSLCGDPIAYCEALTELESRRASRQALALAATGGSLLDRIQRVLGEPPRRSWAGASSAALALTVLLAAAGSASYLGAAPPDAVDTQEDFGVRKPRDAAWPVTFVYPGGEYRMIGFSGRSLVATA
jgi:beta-lactamase regulating signal transducer with metallopeptidase domain